MSFHYTAINSPCLPSKKGAFPLKTFYWGQRGARDNYALQMKNIVEAGYRSLGEIPVIIGECGVPIDMK
jgi:hypothetical protein